MKLRGYGHNESDSNGGIMQRNFVELRGYGQDKSDSNGGIMQRHFVELRGYGHDKSTPTPDGMNVDKCTNH